MRADARVRIRRETGLRRSHGVTQSRLCRRLSPRGSVALMTVWVIALLSLLAVALSAQSLSMLEVSDRAAARLEASYLAVAGVQHTLTILGQDATMKHDSLNEPWSDHADTFAHQPFGNGSFTVLQTEPTDAAESKNGPYGMIDEERKLNLNTAPVEVLQRLFQTAGDLDSLSAAALADAVVDWRDADSDPQPKGAEDSHYLSLRMSYACKDAPFENVEELHCLRGMTLQLFSQVAPYVTVFGSGQVNVNTAEEIVLKALGLSPEAAIAVIFYRAGEDNLLGTVDDRVLASVASLTLELTPYLSAEDINVLERANRDGLLAVGSQAFSCSLMVTTDRLTDYPVLSCVVHRDGRILRWIES